MMLIKFLNYPYPFYENYIQGLKICLSIGFFIGAFCFFFKPFGLDQVSDFAQLGYGFISLIVCTFYIVLLPLLFKKYLNGNNWKIYKEIIWVCIITLSLTIANYFYSGYAFQVGYTFDLKSFLIVLLYTAIVAIIPAVTIILYKQLFVYKKIIREVEKMDSQIIAKNEFIKPSNDLLTINSNSKKDSLEMNVNDFLILVSSGNYVEIYFKDNSHLQKKLIRNNISKVEKQIAIHKNIIRCHRSYLVNLDHIKNITGNLQGYQLHFNDIDWQVPVSRSFTKTIKSKILDLK